ncbi:hypothetical protein M569_12058, partial [Genlisea aurea]
NTFFSSSLSLSTLSLTSTESSLTDSSSSDDKLRLVALRLLAPPPPQIRRFSADQSGGGQTIRRCKWISKSSDAIYVQFHDECWGVPVYDDNELFELLTMCGMLMDFNWTHILTRRQTLREAFAHFDPRKVSEMSDKEISAITANKDMNLSPNRVRCIVGNAKCVTKASPRKRTMKSSGRSLFADGVLQVVDEYGSLINYMWELAGYRAVINAFKHHKDVPLKSPKSEMMSRDMLRRGFRLVGPVVVYSFMQAAGMTVDHLVDCYRYQDCVRMAQAPW